MGELEYFPEDDTRLGNRNDPYSDFHVIPKPATECLRGGFPQFCSFVCVVELNGSIDIHKAAVLLPIDNSMSVGSIVGIKFENIRRGSYAHEPGKRMENMATIRLVIFDPIQRVSRLFPFKLSSRMIHITGLKSMELVHQIVYFLQCHLYKLHSELIQKPIEVHFSILQWLAHATRDWSDQSRGITLDPGIPNWTSDLGLVEIYKRSLPDMPYWADYANALGRLVHTTGVYLEDLSVAWINRNNFFYNYSLGNSIDRQALASAIHGRDGFLSDFQNRLRPTVRVILECSYCTASPNRQASGRAPIPKNHTFAISANGKVIQSSPCEEHSYWAYYRLVSVLVELGFLSLPSSAT